MVLISLSCVIKVKQVRTAGKAQESLPSVTGRVVDQQCGAPGTGKCEAHVVTSLHKVLCTKGAQTSHCIVVTTDTHISTS